MSEKLPIYMLTSREHKVDGLRTGLAPYGIDVGWIKTPPHSKEPDHIEDPAEAAIEKLRMFAALIGQEKIAAQVPEAIDWWRLLIMDVGGHIAKPSGKRSVLTTCRSVAVVGEKINGTAKQLIHSPDNREGMKEVVWEQAAADALQGRGVSIGNFGARVEGASLLVNQKLAREMERSQWYYRVRMEHMYRGVKVVNASSSGGIDWTKLPYVLADGEEMVWRSGGNEYRASGRRLAEPDIQDGMLEAMYSYLKGFPQSTLEYLASLTD